MIGRVLVVAGLKREAALLAGRNHEAVLSGGDRAVLQRRLDAIDPSGVAAVISFGLAGALDETLPVGAVSIPDSILSEDGQDRAADPVLVQSLRGGGVRLGLTFAEGTLLGLDRMLLTAGQKSEARATSGAAVVDMESHVAAAWAAKIELPFAALRVVSDAASRDLPTIVGRVMRPDGGIDVGRLVSGLLRDPRQIPGLIATGRDAGRAFSVLRRVGGLLGEGLALNL